jgi:hypothetical protein
VDLYIHCASTYYKEYPFFARDMVAFLVNIAQYAAAETLKEEWHSD